MHHLWHRGLNRRHFLWYGVTGVASSVLLKACASPSSDSTSVVDGTDGDRNLELGDFKVAIALPGVMTDGGWNQSGYDGVKRAADALGIEMVMSFTGDFNDIARGKEAALALIASGVDVMLHNLDNSAPAVMEVASEKGVYMFGNTRDQFDMAPDVVLTSAVQDIGGAIAYVINEVYTGNFEGKKYVLGLEHPDIGHLGRINDVVPEDVKQKIEEAKQAMLAGDLVLAACEENGEPAVCQQ